MGKSEHAYCGKPGIIVWLLISTLGYFTSHVGAQSFELTRIDSTNNVGRNCIIKIDSIGFPHILYNDVSNGHLKHGLMNSNGDWDIYDTGLITFIDDFEIDVSGNIHCSKAASSTLKYHLITADTVYTEVVDSINFGYSDSELEFFMGNPKIICIQYHTPAYLLEFTRINDIWESDGVTLLPIYPTCLSYIVKGSVNHASCMADEPVIMYFSWTETSITKDTVYQDSFYVVNDMDVTDDGRVMIIFNEDFSRDYNMILAEKSFNQWQFGRVDTSIGYTANFLVNYSELDETPYIMFIDIHYENDTLSLGYRQNSNWEFEDIYSGNVSRCSFEIDFFGNIHCCFWVQGSDIDKLYYGFRQRVTAVRDAEADYVKPFDFEIYPNPTNNTAILSFQTTGHEKPTNYAVFDILGRKLYEITNIAHVGYAGVNKFKIDYLKNLKSGVYFISLTSGNGTSTKKLTLIK